jgi:hypothetical protein
MGYGESCADRTHDEKEREGEKVPFWVLHKLAKKSQKQFQSRRQASKKKEKRLGHKCNAIG